MSQLLISFDCSSDPESESSAEPVSYSLQLHPETLQQLVANFAVCPNICPVISLGNPACGRSSILDCLVKQGKDYSDLMEPETEDESVFSSVDRPSGVYIWPKPVLIGDISLLLVKMWGVDFRDNEASMKDLIDKTLVALLAVGSMVLICAEKGNMWQSLGYIQEVYGKTRERLGLEVGKFVLFVENEGILTRGNMRSSYGKFQAGEFAGITKILGRGDRGISEDCFEKLKALVADPDSHMAYFTTHQPVMPHIQATNFAHGLTIILTSILKVANLDLDFPHFLTQIPHFSAASFEQDMQLLEDLDRSQRLQQTASALELFASDLESYSINEAAVEVLQREYDLTKPTIVMLVMGHPGMGKSTLLNNIVKANTGSPKLLNLFKTGNTTGHTTRASQVLSHPLSLGESQLMLVDLEGLGGMETSDDRIAVLQANLVSALLTICSVPCILVRNEVQNMQFVERILLNLCRLQDYFGFQIERIHLLFQDRDLQPGGYDNPQFIEHVMNLNRMYFEGREVLRLQNKPNFSVKEKAVMCEVFLHDLLRDSNFPKRNRSGSCVNIATLLVEMKYIMSHCNTNLNEIRLSVEEASERDSIELAKSQSLQSIADSVICQDENMSLIAIFNQEIRVFMGKIEEEFAASNLNLRKHIIAALENKAGLHRLDLAQVEYCFRAVRAMSYEELRKKLTEQLEYFYREAWWINTFLDRSNELKNKLIQIAYRYPKEGKKMAAVLDNFEVKQTNLRNWFLANYGFQVTTTMVSGGLGIAAKGATIAASAAKLGYAALVSGSALVGRLAYGATATLALTETAMELYSQKGRKLCLNQKLAHILSIEDVPTLVLLVLGTRPMRLSYLLNEFVRHVSPFTSSSLEAFSDSKACQALHFAYQRLDYGSDEEAKPVSCRGFMMYIGMEDREMRKVATSLISKVSLTCLFVDQPERYAEQMIAEAFLSIGQFDWENSPLIPKVAAFYKNAYKKTAFLGKLLNIGVPNVAIPLRNFEPVELKSALVSVKGEFDVSAMMTSEALLRALEQAEYEANCAE